MMTSFSRPLKPETVDQVMLCRVAVPRWGTSSSVRRRRARRVRCCSSSGRGFLRSRMEMRPGRPSMRALTRHLESETRAVWEG